MSEEKKEITKEQVITAIKERAGITEDPRLGDVVGVAEMAYGQKSFYTFNEIINEIEEETDLGKEHIEIWRSYLSFEEKNK